jgi:hypothetical protein
MQHAIGWNQILKGRWSTEWVRIYDIIYPQQGEKYATNQLHSIWTATIAIWKQRCNALHNIEKNDPACFKQLLSPKVQALYAMKQEIDQIDRQALEQPMSTTMNLPIKHLKGWIKQTDSFIRQALLRRKKRIQLSTHAITQFFRPTRSHSPPSAEAPQTITTQTVATHHNRTAPHSKENLKPP